MTSCVVIVGAGGHGRELLDVIEAQPRPDEFLGFLDDGDIDPALVERRGTQRLGPIGGYESLDAAYLIGIGDPSTRARIDHQLAPYGATCDPLVHPLASVGSDNELAPGVVLCAGSRITTNVHLGRHTHLNVNAVVSHDCRVGDYVTLSPGVLINGNVCVNDRVFVGTGAIVLPGLRIGANAVIGAGAVVTRDVAANVTVAGVPARPAP